MQQHPFGIDAAVVLPERLHLDVASRGFGLFNALAFD
jgi:hypothetical protein